MVLFPNSPVGYKVGRACMLLRHPHVGKGTLLAGLQVQLMRFERCCIPRIEPEIMRYALHIVPAQVVFHGGL